ncbi:MAG: biofilm regulation protein kinase SiaB [Wenzhouxiangellaceae bacterium]|nr:biofilm regulation protein kinase SiaB [Wenzhouxiangellaceae bacterium]
MSEKPQSDLYQLREYFSEHRIMLCFNGPISRSLIEEVGHALRNYLEVDQAHPSAAMDVFAVYIEMSQNIRHYSQQQNYSDARSSATIVVGRDDQGHYFVQAGNIVEAADGEAMLARIEELAGLDKDQLRKAYKTQLRAPRDHDAVSGAGLGLLDISRKSSQPMQGSLKSLPDGRSFLSLTATL